MKIKSAIIINDFDHVNGGAGQVALSSAQELSNRNLDVTVFSAAGSICSNEYKKNYTKISIGQNDILNEPNRLVAASRGLWNIRAGEAFKSLLQTKDRSSTIIHIHSWTKALSPIILQKTIQSEFRYVLTLHDYFITCPNGGYFNYRTRSPCGNSALSIRCLTTNCDSRSYSQKIWRTARQGITNHILTSSKTAINLIYVSDFAKKKIEADFQMPAHWHFLNNPIEAENEPRILAEHNSTFCYLGRLSREKGAHLFAQAASKSGVECCFIGTGDVLEDIKVQAPGALQFGWRDREEIKHILNKVRALVVPSLWYETFGLVVREAMSRGIPCIVANGTAPAELINHLQNGVLFERGSVDSLADVLSQLAIDNDLIERLSENAYSTYWESPNDIHQHTSNLIDIYNRILEY